MPKAITLHQPWATALFHGKRYETRNWATGHRGKLLIHAGKKFNRDSLDITSEHLGIGEESMDFPTGALLGVVNVIDCIKMTPEFIDSVDESEKELGDWSPGNYAWKLSVPSLFDEPIPYKGKQGIFDVPDVDVAEQMSQLFNLVVPERQAFVHEYDNGEIKTLIKFIKYASLFTWEEAQAIEQATDKKVAVYLPF